MVCNITLSIALNGATSAIREPRRTSFGAQAVKQHLGVAMSQWDGFMYRMRVLSERKVKNHEAMNRFLRVLCNSDTTQESVRGLINERALKKVQALHDGHGRGAEVDVRKRGIGSSDATTAVGLSPYKSPLELWLEKKAGMLLFRRPIPIMPPNE